MTEERRDEEFSPGYFIQKEIDSRGWSQVDLAAVLGRPFQVVNEIIAGRRGISAETARGLAEAFGTTPDVWLNLDLAYQQSRGRDESSGVALRAKIYSKGPIKEMIRRGWIQDSGDATELSQEVQDFYGLNSIDDEPAFGDHAARKGTPYEDATLPQNAWLCQTKHVALKNTPNGHFNDEAFVEALDELKQRISEPARIAEIPSILDSVGIRFVIVEHLPQTRIDGACYWVHGDEPVIAMSFRYDRLDYFWYTLAHELAHVEARDGLENDNLHLDTDLIASHTPSPGAKPDFEIVADSWASDFLIPQDRLEAFIAVNRPLYSRRKILDFATELDVHPAILVGQLQYRGEILYSHSRDQLVKARHLITGIAPTDGWTTRKRSA